MCCIYIFVFIQVISQRHFPKCNFSSNNFPSGNFPNVQFPKRLLLKGWVRPSEAPQIANGGKRCGQDGLRGRAMRLEQARWRALRLEQTWEVAAWKIAQLGSQHLGKYPWEVAAWGKIFRKVPNILFYFIILCICVLYSIF